MSSFEHNFRSAKPAIEGYVHATFDHDREEESNEEFAENEEELDITPFATREKEDQAQLLFEVQSLVAERRDLVKSLDKERSAENETPTEHVFQGDVIKQNGRYIAVRGTKTNPLLEPVSFNAIKETEAKLTRIEAMLGKLNRIPGLKEAYEVEVSKLWFHVRIMQKYEELKGKRALIDAAISDLTQKAAESKTGAVVGIDERRHQLLLSMKEEVDTQLESMNDEESFGPVLVRLLKLKDYGENYERGKIVEIPSAEATIERALSHMRNGQPYMIAGHLGSGKTEMARHVARLYMIEKSDPGAFPKDGKIYEAMDPEFFSGAEEASVYDLIGKLKLAQTERPDFGEIKRTVDAYVEEAKAQGIHLDANRITEQLLSHGQNTVTSFNYGPLGRAIKEDKPIIIDEINMMPQDVVARINDLMLKKPGEKVRLQENGEEEFVIGPRFAILSTLNIGKQYRGVKEFNAAFKSRWVGEEVDYPNIEETFDLLLVALMRKDRLRLPPNFPPDGYAKLIDLSITVREVQDLFSGKSEGQRFMAQVRGGSVTAEKSQLARTVISTRDVMKKIIEPWKKSGFSKPLDTIIAENILAPAGIDAKDDQKFMTELFLRRGFFEGWKADDFAHAGVLTVSDQEIETLQALQGQEEYKKANEAYDTLAEIARRNAGTVRQPMLIGNRTLMDIAE